jgi:phospholipase C
MSRLSVAVLAVILLFPVAVPAAEQLVLGSQLSLKNPSTPEKRKIGLSAKEKMTTDTLVGNPVANGATLTIRVTGGSLDGDTYNLPQGTSLAGKPFWTGDAVKGFKYKDPKGDNGPVASASISLKNGTMQIKAGASGKNGDPINVVPPNPGADGCAILALTGGDSYSMNFASGVAKNSGTKSFSIKKPTQKGKCVRQNPNSLPIDHIVLLMQENRSADHYLGRLSLQGQPAYEAEPNTGNPDPTNPLNPPILPFHETAYCEVADLDHSWKGTHAEIHGGAMDGFTAQNVNGLDPTGSRTMGYYDQTDLPFYYGMYNTFAIGDRYFASAPTQTFPNRLFFLAGTSFGYTANSGPGGGVNLDKPSIFNLLDDAGITWRIYAHGQTQTGLLQAYGATLFQYVADRRDVRVFPTAQYFADLAAGTLPNVAFIDPDFGGDDDVENDEHPPSDVQLGQKFSSDIINALMGSSAWATSALFFTYDEHGGYYDHVPPPAAVIPDGSTVHLSPGDPPGQFNIYGIRVPVAVLSPYSKPAFVSHVVNDHTSMLHFVETRFALPTLTARDAAANPMLEFFDFNTATFATPPIDPGQLTACGS